MRFEPGNQYARKKQLVPVAGPPPAVPVLDELPAKPAAIVRDDVDFGQIRRLTRENTEKWAWVLKRMRKTWPDLTENAAYNRLYSAVGSNEFMVICHDAGASMAHVWREPIESRVWIRQLFLYVRDPEVRAKRTRVSAAMQLLRHTEAWGRTMKAARYEIEGASDLDPAELVETMKGAYHDTVYRDLTKLAPL